MKKIFMVMLCVLCGKSLVCVEKYSNDENSYLQIDADNYSLKQIDKNTFEKLTHKSKSYSTHQFIE